MGDIDLLPFDGRSRRYDRGHQWTVFIEPIA